MADALLPYGRHLIEPDDVAAVTAVLTGDCLTQGPQVAAFEAALAERVGARHAVASASGTSALHLAMTALGLGEGDVCIVPAITFLSTATAARMCGAEVVFADVDADSGLMGPAQLAEAAARAGRPVKLAAPVHLGGRMCDMPRLAAEAARLGVTLIEDGCHALGSGTPEGGRVGEGRFSAATAFSFHPVKTIACGEGGMVTLNDPAMAARIQRLRNHGVTRDVALMVDPELSLDTNGERNLWSYEQLELGYNYRMTDLEAALGLSQLGKLDRFMAARTILADRYDSTLSRQVRPAPGRDAHTSLHLYSVLIDFEALDVTRQAVMKAMAKAGIGTQTHYIPLYRQPYFVRRYGELSLTGAEAYYGRTLSLPLFPAMTPADVDRAVRALTTALGL